MRAFRTTLVFAGLFLSGSPLWAESLWQKRTPTSGFLFVDNRARRPGDLLTIIIRENTGIDYRDRRDMDKENSASGIFGLKGGTQGDVVSKSVGANLDVSGNANRKFVGNAQFISDRRFDDRMTVVVIDVLPNGNLVIEGTRRLMVTGEERFLRITGIVRPVDIGSGNIVESQYIGNFQAIYRGRGPESRFTNHNWFGQAANYLWPF